MTIKKIVKNTVLAASLTLVFATCGDDDGQATFDASTTVDASGFVCDPVGANAEMGGLLNAAVDSDVEVIVKTPQHPGDPGPTNLP